MALVDGVEDVRRILDGLDEKSRNLAGLGRSSEGSTGGRLLRGSSGSLRPPAPRTLRRGGVGVLDGRLKHLLLAEPFEEVEVGVRPSAASVFTSVFRTSCSIDRRPADADDERLTSGLLP